MLPKTPFSTALSVSARETQRRLRNLFQGKKKRPPWPVLTLTALIILLCGSLVSCQTAGTDNSGTAGHLFASLGEPTLSLQMDGVFAQLPGFPAGEAPWPEELPGLQFSTGFVDLDISLNLEKEPDEVRCTEYLVLEGQATHPLARTVHLHQASGKEGSLPVERRADSDGEGMETRLYVLTCTWRDSQDTLSLEYSFLLTLPSVAADAPVDEPVIVAAGQRVEPNGTCSATYPDVVIVNAPQRADGWLTVSAAVEDGETIPVVDRTPVGGDGNRSVTFSLAPLGVKEGQYPAQTQRYTLVYEWDDGTQDTYHFTIYASQLLTIGEAVAEAPVNESAVDEPAIIHTYEVTAAGSV